MLFDTDRNPDLTEDQYGLFEWKVHLFADDWNAREDKLMQIDILTFKGMMVDIMGDFGSDLILV